MLLHSKLHVLCISTLYLQVAYKILDLYVKLHELGHIEYINEGEVGPPLHCSVSTETAEETVAQIEAKLTSWRKEVKDLLNKFEWLHFFSVPKLLRMSQLLCQEHEDTDCHIRRVVHEISFLCKNDSVTRTKMYGEVQVSFKMLYEGEFLSSHTQRLLTIDRNCYIL